MRDSAPHARCTSMPSRTASVPGHSRSIPYRTPLKRAAQFPSVQSQLKGCHPTLLRQGGVCTPCTPHNPPSVSHHNMPSKSNANVLPAQQRCWLPLVFVRDFPQPPMGPGSVQHWHLRGQSPRHAPLAWNNTGRRVLHWVPQTPLWGASLQGIQ